MQYNVAAICGYVLYFEFVYFEKRREVLFWVRHRMAVSAVSADVLPYSSIAIKASFLKLGNICMCNICKNNIAKMFLDF